MSKLSEYARGLVIARVERMSRLLKADAPDVLVANEAALIGEAGMLLDPAGHAERVVARAVRDARRALGLCSDHKCESDAVVSSGSHEGEPAFCDAHEREYAESLQVGRCVH